MAEHPGIGQPQHARSEQSSISILTFPQAQAHLLGAPAASVSRNYCSLKCAAIQKRTLPRPISSAHQPPQPCAGTSSAARPSRWLHQYRVPLGVVMRCQNRRLQVGGEEVKPWVCQQPQAVEKQHVTKHQFASSHGSRQAVARKHCTAVHCWLHASQ